MWGDSAHAGVGLRKHTSNTFPIGGGLVIDAQSHKYSVLFTPLARAGNTFEYRYNCQEGLECIPSSCQRSKEDRILMALCIYNRACRQQGKYCSSASAAQHQRERCLPILRIKPENIDRSYFCLFPHLVKGLTPLMEAAIRGDQDIVTLLIEKGARIQDRDMV